MANADLIFHMYPHLSALSAENNALTAIIFDSCSRFKPNSLYT